MRVSNGAAHPLDEGLSQYSRPNEVQKASYSYPTRSVVRISFEDTRCAVTVIALQLEWSVARGVFPTTRRQHRSLALTALELRTRSIDP